MTPPSKFSHSRLSKVLVLISGLVLFLFFVVSLFLGKEVNFKVELDLSVPPDQILPAISDLRKWREWTVWDEEYYQHVASSPIYHTNEMGEAVKSVEKQVQGNQKQVIVMERKEKTLERVVFEYAFFDGDENEKLPLIRSLVLFSLTPHSSNLEMTRITWKYQADYSSVIGINPLQKYFLLFTKFTLKRAYQESLANLKMSL